MVQSAKIKVVADGVVGALAIAGTIVLAPVLRPWYRRWGATEAEARAPLPGDAWVPQPRSEITCAITIHAPVSRVWSWLVQLGCGRGGWYSYDLLDNGGTPSADRIMPAYQQLHVGDIVKAVPRGEFGFPVALIEPEHALTLAGTLNTATGQPVDVHDPTVQQYFRGDQTWVLHPLPAHATRLIFRTRMDWNASWPNELAYRMLIEPISFVMGRKMVRTLKRRAEQTT